MINKKDDTNKSKKIGFWEYLSLYYKVNIAEVKHINGYEYKKKKTSPIVGNHFYEGYEIINPNTNKVLYRKLKDYGYVDDAHSTSDYTVTREFFKHNIIDYDKRGLAYSRAVETLIRVLQILRVIAGLCLITIWFVISIILFALIFPILIISPICWIFTGRSLISDYCNCKLMDNCFFK